MASSDPHATVDNPDDDEFDWDAAVRAIDIACANSKASTSSADPFRTPSFASRDAPRSSCNAPFATNMRMNGAPRQSTLDKFIGRAGLRTEPVYRAVAIEGQRNIDGDDRVSCVEIDVEAAKTWIYPVNIPLRDYQLSITKTALFTNTLVALPTGLGKTLIAAVVMYNYFRWFPEGKIVFTAPSRPLVVQQIEACHNIVGIPQDLIIDMTGQICPAKRADFWKTKRVFFVTPQVLEKDIQSGTCLVKYLVCLVIDEAHRALGNYSYCVAVRELMAIPVQLRLLALTATPGSKQDAIQHVINNLLISSLEYRDESDPDVSPYVHNRKIELIQVPMGEEATQINNLLLNVIRTYASKLNTMGILLNRDYQALSPSDLLNSRDKFRQAPPTELPPVRYAEVERCFGALITLYHIRKLLSSHGIKPAYEMLEEKLQQGSFAGLMNRNEDIQKAKLLMQQNLSRGAPNPKLSKMLEVLIDHFRINDMQSSRVIIFSNFRGSVRDIMETLLKLGDTVKAAQFVGQSSGKSLKGQSQKVQQAVLEKFRSGGYNVIVATSIGEEGLDIMEVDLVICFDANVSPLRMVQRMGRTGRKHDGRVVVLACEGSEMKAYMRKQANSKTIKKHMRNGGIASFNFHSSPRMIPHIFKPEVQFVELSIEKFVPRGKRVKEDQFTEPQRYREILTTEEADLISKYFKNTENRWKPSLIAFPHFQTFPSSVHKVTHSSRTGMLIDSMQLLQGHIFSSTKDEEEAYSFPQMDAPLVEQNIWDEKDSRSIESPDMNTEMWPASSTRIKGIADKHELLELQHGNHPTHSSLFGSDFVAVDTLGNVSILLVPPFYIMEASHTKHNAISVEHPKYLMTDNEKSHISAEPTKLQARTAKDASEQPLSPNFSVMIETRLQFGLHEPNWQNGPVDAAEKSMEGTYVDEMPREMDSPICTPDGIVVKGSLVDDAMETELSPRLTNYIESGVVPESPVGGTTKAIATSEFQEFQEMDILETPKRAKISTRFLSTSSSPNSVKFEKAILDPLVSEGNASHSPATDRKDFVVDSVKHGASERCDCGSSEGEIPPETTPSGCCSRDWYFTPRDEGSIKQPRKLKRLRKIGEVDSHAHLKYQKNYVLSCGAQSKVRGKKTRYKNGRAYIEEEAEVSSGADTSGEEEDGDGEDDSYDDSFMDDRINPTAGSPHAAVTSSIDMMAIYRRSLLSQSPMAWQPNNNTTPDPHSVAVATTSGSAYSSETRTAGRISSEDAMNPPGFIPEAGEASKVWNRKRKLGAEALDSLAALNLEELLIDGGEVVGEEVIDGGEVVGEEEKGEGECDPFSDDQFYDDIDLDEVEAHATLLLKHKPEPPRPDQGVVVPVKDDSINTDCLVSPSFDLGI